MSAKVKGLEATLAKVNRIASSAQRKRILRAGARKAHEIIAEAPKKAPGAFSRLATPAQKRAYWAKVRSGEAEHRDGIGYVRTSTLVRAWTISVPSDSRAIVGNRYGWGVYVQGEQQQAFHRESGWVTTRDVATKHADKIGNQMEIELARVLKLEGVT